MDIRLVELCFSSLLAPPFLPSKLSTPAVCVKLCMILVRNLPYITETGARSCKSHGRCPEQAIMKMDGLERVVSGSRIPQASPPITVITGTQAYNMSMLT